MERKLNAGTDMRSDPLEPEVALLRAKRKMREEMGRAWEDFFAKNPDVKEGDVRRRVEKRLRRK